MVMVMVMVMLMLMLMLSPNPFSLFCALLLCFPLALLFSLFSNNNNTNSPTLFIPHLHHHASSLTLLSPPPPHKPPLTPLYKTTSKQIKSTFPKIPFPTPPPPPPPPLKTTTSKRIKSAPTKIPSSTPSPLRIPPNKSRKNPRNRITSKRRNSSLPKIPLPTPPPHASPPPYPEDDRDDIDLLKRASRVNPDTVGGQKKVAFLFLTTTPLPFASIWEKFFNQSHDSQGRYNIYIHTNPDSNRNRKSDFTGVFYNRVIPTLKPTARNTPTLVSAARRLLAHALLDDPNNYMFTLVSASCIPLHSFNLTYTTLTNSNKSFIEILNNETTAYSRWAARGEYAMLPEVPVELFRIGSQFWSLTRRHARVVVKDVKLWRKFRVPCVDIDVCFPEENYFPTLLSMVDPDGVVPATLTNVNWEGSYDGHPRTYNETEVGEELIQWLRESRPRYGEMGINSSDLTVMKRWDPFLFARKFAPACVQSLLKITNNFLFKD